MHKILDLWAIPRSTSTAFEWMMRQRGDMQCFHEPYGEAWCEGVGIPFIEAALSWKPGARNEVSWWDGGSFHANLRDSDGLKPQARSQYIEIDEMPDRVKDVYEKMMPHYEHMHRYRLRVSQSAGAPA